jgi:radical SAM superfamily enzyme YgiQ (UPF0313 family)
MRVLLINPWEGEVFPTPAIGYLQAVLKANDIDVRAMDLSKAMNEPDKYDLTAVTFHSFSVKYARLIRDHFKGHLICGGHHPSALPDQMLSIGYDQVIIGEGEKAIMDVINGNTSKIIRGEISDIDSIPYPDYSGLTYWGTMGIPIISSRGCPFSCSFCASSHFWNRKYRMRSVDDVLNEISLRLREGFKEWMFEDDLFTGSKNRTVDICGGISEMGKFNWQCASRAESLDEDICRALKLAGCKTVWLGIESLSQDSLNRCNKNTTVEKMLKGIETAEKYGLETMCQFIIGLPGDTINDINLTVKNIKRSSIKRKGTNILWVLPHTSAYQIAKENGFSDEVYLQNGAPFFTFEQSLDILRYWSSLIDQI